MSNLKKRKASKLLKLGDLLLSTGAANSGIPLAAAVYNFAKMGAATIKEYIDQRNEKKLSEFHLSLLSDSNGNIDSETYDSEIEAADYYALLSACLSDIEDEKTAIYGNLAKAIAKKKIPEEYRRHCIFSLKDTTWDQLDLLSEIYVLSKHKVIPPAGTWSRKAADFIAGASQNRMQSLNISALSSKHFIDSKDITDLGETFIQACMPEENLKPGAFNYKTWVGANYYHIILGEEGGTLSYVCSKIDSHYRERGVAAHSGLREGILDRKHDFVPATFFIISYINGKTLPDSRLESLKQIIRKRPALQIIIKPDSALPTSPILDIDHLVFKNNGSDFAEQVYQRVGKLLLMQRNSQPT